MPVNVVQTNLEDILDFYFEKSPAKAGAHYLLSTIHDGNDAALTRMLRDYRTDPIIDPVEVVTRTSIDRLLTCYSVLEIASIARFIPPMTEIPIGKDATEILSNDRVSSYYREFYPTILPQLLIYRLKSGQGLKVSGQSSTDNSLIAFMSLDRFFVESLEDGPLLRMLDSYTVDGYRFRHVAELISQPEAFINALTEAPDSRDALAMAAREFGQFLGFCGDLQKLLERIESEPLLQSAIWFHYGYWFNIIGSQLSKMLWQALETFLSWGDAQRKPDQAASQILKYVEDSKMTLTLLTSGRYAAPIQELMNGKPSSRFAG